MLSTSSLSFYHRSYPQWRLVAPKICTTNVCFVQLSVSKTSPLTFLHYEMDKIWDDYMHFRYPVIQSESKNIIIIYVIV